MQSKVHEAQTIQQMLAYLLRIHFGHANTLFFKAVSYFICLADTRVEVQTEGGFKKHRKTNLMALGNSRHLAKLPLVSPPNNITSEKRAQKFHTDVASLPRSG